MNEKRQMLIFKAWKNGGHIKGSTANRLYSGNQGKDALQSLVFQGYFEEPTFGVFKLNKDKLSDLPQEVVSKIKTYEESRKDSSDQSREYSREVEKQVEVPANT